MPNLLQATRRDCDDERARRRALGWLNTRWRAGPFESELFDEQPVAHRGDPSSPCTLPTRSPLWLQLLERAVRFDAGGSRTQVPALGTRECACDLALKTRECVGNLVISSLERLQLFVPRARSLELVITHTPLLTDFVAHRTLTGDVEIALAASMGNIGLMQLFDRGTNDRKHLEALICVVLRKEPPSPPPTPFPPPH